MATRKPSTTKPSSQQFKSSSDQTHRVPLTFHEPWIEADRQYANIQLGTLKSIETSNSFSVCRTKILPNTEQLFAKRAICEAIRSLAIMELNDWTI